MNLLYGIDLDGICFDFIHAFCKWLEDKADISIPKDEEITSYYWYETIDGLDKEIFDKEFDKFGKAKGYAYLDLIPGTLEALNSIKDSGNEIVYITNRPEYAKLDTEIALAYHCFPFKDNLVFANGCKSPIINNLNVNVFIDDSPSTIKELVNNTDARIYCKDYPFNQHLHNLFGYTRVHSWEEFLTYEQITSRIQRIQ